MRTFVIVVALASVACNIVAIVGFADGSPRSPWNSWSRVVTAIDTAVLIGLLYYVMRAR